MAEDITMSGIMWQWLREHKQDILDYFSTIMREASDIQIVNFDTERHAGLLASYIYQGIRRIENVSPTSIVEGLSRLGQEVRERCDNAAASAERAAGYAQTEGDRVADALADYQTLYDRVSQQGNSAEQQGAEAQQIHDVMFAWFLGQNNNGFKHDAETLYSQFEGFVATSQQQWEDFYTEGVVPDWDEFWSRVLANWQQWEQEEASRKGILCIDFSYDYDEGELIMDYVERDRLSMDMFSFDNGDFIVDYNL